MNILIISQRWYPDTFGGSEHVAAEQARRLAVLGHKVTIITERVRGVLPEIDKEKVEGKEGGSLVIYRYGSPAQLQRFGGASRTDLKEVPRLLNVILKEVKRSESSRATHGGRDSFPPKADQNDSTLWDAAIVHHPFPAYGFFKSGIEIPTLYLFHASTAAEAEVEGIRRRLPFFLKPVRPIFNRIFIGWARRIEAAALHKASRIAVLSDFSRKVLQETYPFIGDKIISLPIGIDLESFKPETAPGQAREKLGFSSGKPLLLTVRRFTPRMGLTTLIRAMEIALKQIPQAQLLIVGEGPLKTALQAEIEARQLRGRVTLVGAVPVEDLPLYYQAADLFVLPTEAFEGLGMATLEALASGLPVVGTPAGATPEVLGKLDTKLITSGTGAEDIARGILEFFSRSEEERMSLKKRSREVAEKYYSWSEAVGALEMVLVRL